MDGGRGGLETRQTRQDKQSQDKKKQGKTRQSISRLCPRHFHFLAVLLQTGVYILIILSTCGKAVLHDRLLRLQTVFGFDSRGSSDVTHDGTSDVIIFSRFGSLPKRHQPKRRTNGKVPGAQEKGVGGTAQGCPCARLTHASSLPSQISVS